MALLRKKSSVPAGRRRLPADSEQPRGFSYRASASNRLEADFNTGRRADRPRPAAKLNARAVRRFWAQRFGLIILCTAVLVAIISVLSLSTHAEIMPLKSSDKGAFLRDQATYQAAADKLLASSIWNRNKITIDTGAFSQHLMQQFPELSSVSVTLPLLVHRPVVYLQPAQPALILSTNNGSFVIDDRGKALLTADSSSSEAALPQVVDQSGLRVQLNHQVLSSQSVTFIQTVVAQLAAKHMTVSSMVLPAGTNELDVHLAGQTYFVKFNLHDNSARQQVGTFLATIAQLQKNNTPPAKYIDVRVLGRAYYQ
ncbi:MAG TPA: hypothetical protein VHC21_02540 [Candidatus Saccharimonadales bacterium]|nr:hypothetical protein [Candidatus Saccharimonadales bacterium]